MTIEPVTLPELATPDAGTLRVVFVAGGRLFGEKLVPPDPARGRGPVARPTWREERRHLIAELHALNNDRPIDRLVHGDCRTKALVPTGADKWAAVWAIHNGVWCYGCPAPFPKLGPSAGPKRTAMMFDDWHPYHACSLIAFPGGQGTARAVELAHERNMHVIDLRTRRS